MTMSGAWYSWWMRQMQWVFMASDDAQLVKHMAHVLLAANVVLVVIARRVSPLPYGRFAWKSRFLLPSNIAWFVQECPSFFVPLAFQLVSTCKSSNNINKWLLGIFMLHYFMRTFIYTLHLKNGNRTQLYIAGSAFLYCSFNGFMQSYCLLCLTEYPASYYQNINCILGVLIFLCGIAITAHSDYLITHLRKPGETGYKIPKGGVYEYVSSANYFGEILEWFGYALATLTYPAFSFAVSSFLLLGSRALQNHGFYLKKFEKYPRSRKAVIPFIL